MFSVLISAKHERNDILFRTEVESNADKLESRKRLRFSLGEKKEERVGLLMYSKWG